MLICSCRICTGESGMKASVGGYRQAYSHWLRTRRWLRLYGSDGRELKFNPYHAADPDDSNGKTDQGYKLLSRIDDILHKTRSQRAKARLKDEEG